jgi:two-component system sensor histidine kinase KdpD
MAAGVGKTYRMLQEGRAALQDGRDVAIGWFEPHGREETIALAQGLEAVPARRVEHRGAALGEMDLTALLERAPELALIDELAHTNAPGGRHEKRWEDVEDVLDAGIDVFSTVNVQHLESLNNQVGELTGVHVRETVPDQVLARADEVVLLDLTPETLLQRLREGRIYPLDRVPAALNNFFRIENLAALRELALRQVAEEVESKRLVREIVGTRAEGIAAEAPQAVGERLLALVSPTPSSQRLVRRAWRSSQRLGAGLDLLLVVPPNRPLDPVAQEQLEALRRLASALGCNLIVEPGEDVAETAARVARELGTTYVLMGKPRPRSPLRRMWAPALPFQVMRRLPGVDVRIVADRTERGNGGT